MSFCIIRPVTLHGVALSTHSFDTESCFVAHWRRTFHRNSLLRVVLLESVQHGVADIMRGPPHTLQLRVQLAVHVPHLRQLRQYKSM